MRFTVTGEWTRNRLLALCVWWFLAYVALLWVTDVLLFAAGPGFSIEGIARHYRGDEASFHPPRSYRALLEMAHFHVFAQAILLLTLTHLLLFVPMCPVGKSWTIQATFVSGLANEAASWLVRFAHPGFAWLKLAAFVTLQASILGIGLLVARALWRGSRSAYADGARSPREDAGDGTCPATPLSRPGPRPR